MGLNHLQEKLHEVVEGIVCLAHIDLRSYGQSCLAGVDSVSLDSTGMGIRGTICLGGPGQTSKREQAWK